METYDTLAKHYDLLTGSRETEFSFVEGLIKEYAPNASSILDIACGTGSLLANFSNTYERFGTDISQEMLEVAKQKLEGVQLEKQDMRSLSFDRKFDAVLCLFDSINHLPTLEDWNNVFSGVKQHLNEDGVFILDINTVNRLEKRSEGSTWVTNLEENILLLDVNKTEQGLYEWLIRIFEPLEASTYTLHETSILESAFPLEMIQEALRKSFTTVKTLDGDGKETSTDEGRRYLVCSL